MSRLLEGIRNRSGFEASLPPPSVQRSLERPFFMELVTSQLAEALGMAGTMGNPPEYVL